MKKHILTCVFALTVSINVNAMGNACALIYNYPTHLVLWGNLDMIIYEWGTMETAAEQVTGSGAWLFDTTYFKEDIDFNQGYAVRLQNISGTPPQPPGAYRIEGVANIFFLRVDPTVQVVQHGEDFCENTVLVI